MQDRITFTGDFVFDKINCDMYRLIRNRTENIMDQIIYSREDLKKMQNLGHKIQIMNEDYLRGVK